MWDSLRLRTFQLVSRFLQIDLENVTAMRERRILLFFMEEVQFERLILLLCFLCALCCTLRLYAKQFHFLSAM